MRTLAPLLALALGLLCAPARAQLLLSDDVETGTLLATQTPPGAWETLAQVSPNHISASIAAPHRGQYGIRMEDVTGGTGTGAAATVSKGIPGVPRDALYARAWGRIARVDSPGTDIFFVSVAATDETQAEVDLLSLSFANPSADAGTPLYARGWSGPAPHTYVQNLLSGSAAPGEWHLYELGLTGLGTATTHRRVWMDGAPLVDQVVDTTTLSPSSLALGEGFGQLSFTGVLDFDDVRLGIEPPASKLAVSLPSTMLRLDCVPVKVSLQDSGGNPARAPYDVVATASPGGVYADAACTAATSTLTLVAGTSEVSGYFHPTGGLSAGKEGKVTLTFSHDDFLKGAATIQVAADPWAFHGGCAAVPAPTWLGLLAVLRARRRRKRLQAL